MKKTAYFPDSVRPIHHGVYEVVTDECGDWFCKEPHRISFRGSWRWKEADFIPNPTGFKWRGVKQS